MTSADPPVPAERAAPEVELKHGAISFLDALVIGLASTSPAYSLAAVIGPIVALVGIYAPGVLLASFVPMVLIASAFYYLNRADQDCGTTFSWVTRAMGPWFGWIGGWAISMTGVLVVGSLADLPRWFPPWAAELAELYFSGTTSAFVLYGNTYDYVRIGDGQARGTAVVSNATWTTGNIAVGFGGEHGGLPQHLADERGADAARHVARGHGRHAVRDRDGVTGGNLH